MYLDILLYAGIMLYVCFVTDCQMGRLLDFEFAVLANHDKSKYYWVRMVYFQVQDKKLKFRMKKVSCNLVLSIDIQLLSIAIWLLLNCCLIFIWLIESRISAKNQ